MCNNSIKNYYVITFILEETSPMLSMKHSMLNFIAYNGKIPSSQ